VNYGEAGSCKLQAASLDHAIRRSLFAVRLIKHTIEIYFLFKKECKREDR
jgi:hypothetical protein